MSKAHKFDVELSTESGEVFRGFAEDDGVTLTVKSIHTGGVKSASVSAGKGQEILAKQLLREIVADSLSSRLAGLRMVYLEDSGNAKAYSRGKYRDDRRSEISGKLADLTEKEMRKIEAVLREIAPHRLL